MNVLSYNPGHDGAVVYIKDGRLIFSIDSEKDSHYRYSALSKSHVLDAIGEIEELPDVICSGGWWPYDHHEFLFGSLRNSGYRGINPERSIIQHGRYFKGKWTTSRPLMSDHILCAFGMSTLPRGAPFYARVWEGDIGAFYEIDSEFNITLLGDVLNQPGNRHGMLYGLADPTFPKDGLYPGHTDAGKLMALASFRDVANLPPKKRSCYVSFWTVPPVANDSGSAIGTAIDAQRHFAGDPKIEWDTGSGISALPQSL